MVQISDRLAHVDQIASPAIMGSSNRYVPFVQIHNTCFCLLVMLIAIRSQARYQLALEPSAADAS